MIRTQADAENDNELMGREDFLEGFVSCGGFNLCVKSALTQAE
jgi:hypothetical protein